jgi:hypothetical protein
MGRAFGMSLARGGAAKMAVRIFRNYWQLPMVATMMDDAGTVSLALHEMNPGYGRHALEIVHGESHRTIHQAVDGQAMSLRIDLGEVGGVLLHEVEVGGRDDSTIILKRSVERDVINGHSHPSARGHSSGQYIAVELGFPALHFSRLG